MFKTSLKRGLSEQDVILKMMITSVKQLEKVEIITERKDIARKERKGANEKLWWTMDLVGKESREAGRKC